MRFEEHVHDNMKKKSTVYLYRSVANYQFILLFHVIKFNFSLLNLMSAAILTYERCDYGIWPNFSVSN